MDLLHRVHTTFTESLHVRTSVDSCSSAELIKLWLKSSERIWAEFPAFILLLSSWLLACVSGCQSNMVAVAWIVLLTTVVDLMFVSTAAGFLCDVLSLYLHSVFTCDPFFDVFETDQFDELSEWGNFSTGSAPFCPNSKLFFSFIHVGYSSLFLKFKVIFLTKSLWMNAFVCVSVCFLNDDNDNNSTGMSMPPIDWTRDTL